ncbi:MAG TPA: CDP-diacylglycerol--serine O-phosphatidyltransferase [Acetomicrobium sp.]|jgi:CDP-diacylglycerol--serine O-phosphatidyltransferase|nr:CDP-diacylglycerol--serine O-phosphatidyltransferase [Acetomicrobium mobile]MBP8674980.1 CDP-diacylglycerol--serine O-phosphatidyltransferase [Acetomicrobium sp.]MDI9377552.1 CDP-diacylglycerol--serine O-phosphatidyltransferase [Synergistota bacterium]NLI42678.1 CDP-diacylglycerol--serine O-phosphatidyltransferase [Synergistaceae bacterium]HOB11039.1 CDP-diacylglycerol--serine O-phosphatidyltransferase [Acetomicrobium sp.]HOM96759.1 CDP-diacylglycerol--serine O-phosphatidyltransferase [Acet
MIKKPIPFRRLAPNMITSGSILCGVMSLVLIFHGHAVPAVWLIFVAAFFDLMDGKVARSLGGDSAFGMEFDSLADIVSFGVVPGLIFYVSYLYAFGGVLGALVISFYVLCGALRLARFNVVHSSGNFQGLPIPAAGLFLVSFVISGIALPPSTAAIIATTTGALMISSISYGNIKQLSKNNINVLRLLFLISCIVTISIFLRDKSALAYTSIYVFSGPIGIDWGKWLSLKGEEVADNR